MQRETGEEVETEEEMDEEGLSFFFVIIAFYENMLFIYVVGQLLLNMRLSYEPEGATILMKQKR